MDGETISFHPISFARLNFIALCMMSGGWWGADKVLRIFARCEREFNEPFLCWLYYKKCNPISKMKKCYQQYVVTNIQCIIYADREEAAGWRNE